MATTEAAPSHTTQLIEELIAYEVSVGNPAELDSGLLQLKAVIGDQSESMAQRRQAIRLLVRSGGQAAVDYLCGIMLVEADAVLRREAVLGLVRLRLHGQRLEFPIRQIRRQIAQEAEECQRIIQVAAICRQQHRGSMSADDPIIELLRTLLEESVEQIFRLLMLLYRPEDVHLVYEQMRASDPSLRADALELLDYLIDPALRTILFPVLDEDRFLALLDERSGITDEPTAAYRVLQEAIWDRNGWLSVATLCAVGRLRLTTMRQELERACRHTAPLTAAAARVALSLATVP